jgi:hypothetical protein
MSVKTTLKWTKDGELSQLDMARILSAMEKKEDVTQMGSSNPRWRNGSPMRD